MNEATIDRLDVQIGSILREYYKEHTMNTKTGWIEKFERAGITDVDKDAIAYARRLGIDIS